MLLGELIAGLPVELVRGDARSVRVCDMTEDSRTVVPGSLFVARRGRVSDGRAYAGDAVRAGASAILTEMGTPPDALPTGVAVLTSPDVPLATARLAERLHGEPGRRLVLVGVTGTNGKSTVTHLVHAILNRCGVRSGMIGTVQVDDGREIAPSPMTTPPAIELSRTLATMVESGCRAAVMEVSSHALDQRRADGLAFDAAIFTNLSGDHLDYHATMEAYLDAKRRLFTLLTPEGVAILNADDPLVRQTHAPRRVLCGMHDPASCDWFVERADPSLDGEWLAFRGAASGFGARVALFGAHNAMNTLQAVAACWVVLGRAGVDERDRRALIERALTLVHPPRGRLEPVHAPGDDLRVFVDFAHSDDALGRALEAVRGAMPRGGRLWVVFGCGGERDRTKRPRMGLAAARGADHVVITSDNPRSEPPARIVGDVLEGVPPGDRGRVQIHIDRALAIRAAIDQASPGDVVLIAGKGHETEQILPDGAGGKVTRRFVDQEFAAGALESRRLRVGGTAGLPG
jgi:UDP-N-acetylmuramoyl-L-alanyl-D-glutamate--2,6-diaminopimelate ligase